MTARRSARLQWWRSWRLRSVAGAGKWKGWSVGVVLAGGAAGRGAVDDAPVPLVLAGGLASLDPDGVVADLDAVCAVACRVEVRGAVALAHGPEGAVGVFASAAHWAVSIFLMALRAVGSEEMPRTRRAS